ncbi:class C sortase [Lacticaseibacillus absianus]|uniref:class C sortase n=1 Tax=Lacticaseibacillus absianus TaxID=2729623 RepID=UPI0015C7F5A0|nr:class C sortase [Lacticaseibacillus absianus]
MGRPRPAKRKPRKMTDILVLLIFAAGLAVFAYPFVAQAVNRVTVAIRVQRDEKLAAENAAKLEAAQEAYNKELAKYGMRPTADAFTEPGQGIQQVQALDDHLIGAVTIPKLFVNLPLYDTVSETLLQAGAVVLPGTSYPRGGKSTHTVVSAHSGVPSKTLFSTLHKLKKGQLFIFTVGEQNLAYKVDKIQTIEPDDTRALTITKGEDRATLMTCTPIGINSHRLLVSGHRVPYTAGTAESVKASQQRAWWQSGGVIAAAVAALGVLGWLLVRTLRRH